MIRKYEIKIDWLLWFLILLPIFYIFGEDVRNAQTDFFCFSVLVMLGLFHVNKYIGLLLLWFGFQVAILKMPIDATQLTNLFIGVLLYQFIVWFGYTQNLKKYLWALCGLLMFNILWIPLQMYNVDPLWTSLNPDKQVMFSEYPGWFNLPAFLGNFCAVALPFCMTLFWPMAIFAVVGLWFSKSTFSIVAAGLAFMAFFWFRKRLVFWLTLIFVVVGMGFYAKQDLQTGQFFRRLECWQKITRHAFKSQFMGHGLGNYGNEFVVAETTPDHEFLEISKPEHIFVIAHDLAARKGDAELVALTKEMIGTKQYDFDKLQDAFQAKGLDVMVWHEAHNEFLQVFNDGGLIALFLVGLYVFDVFRRFLNGGCQSLAGVCLFSAFIAILVISAGHFPFRLARLAGPFIAVLAFVEIHLKRCRKSADASFSCN